VWGLQPLTFASRSVVRPRPPRQMQQQLDQPNASIRNTLILTTAYAPMHAQRARNPPKADVPGAQAPGRPLLRPLGAAPERHPPADVRRQGHPGQRAADRVGHQELTQVGGYGWLVVSGCCWLGGWWGGWLSAVRFVRPLRGFAHTAARRSSKSVSVALLSAPDSPHSPHPPDAPSTHTHRPPTPQPQRGAAA